MLYCSRWWTLLKKNVTTILMVILVAWHIIFFLSFWIGMTSWKIALFFPSFIAGDISGTNANYHAQLQESKRHHYWSYNKQTGGRAMSFTIRNCLVHRAVSLCIRMSQPWSIRPWKMNKYEQHTFEELFRIRRKIHQLSQVRCFAQKGQMHFRIFNTVVAVLPPRSMGSIVFRYGLKNYSKHSMIENE